MKVKRLLTLVLVLLSITMVSCKKDGASTTSNGGGSNSESNYPVVITNSVSNITLVTATFCGEVISDGGFYIEERGFCWSKSQNPTIDNQQFSEAGYFDIGEFVFDVTGLDKNTTYYVRAYAKNSCGISYGEQMEFITSVPVANTPLYLGGSNSFGTYITYDNNGESKWFVGQANSTGIYIMRMWGYNGNNEDWFILQPIKLNGDNIKCSINYLSQYFHNIENELRILVSEDYEYGADPTNYNWDIISVDWMLSTNGSTIDISLDKYLNKTINFAIEYLSSENSAGYIEINSIRFVNNINDMIFEETFANNQGDFSIENVIWPSSLSYIWQHKSNNRCMVANGYADGHTYASESWLISPEIDINGHESAILSFNHAYKYGNNPEDEMTLWVSTDYVSGNPYSANWTKMQIPNYPSGTSFVLVNSNQIDINNYIGNQNKFRFAFKYVSTDNVAPTWEINNVVIIDINKQYMNCK